MDSASLPASFAGIPVVDAHVHVFPARLFEAVWRWFDEHAWSIRYKLEAERGVAFLLSRGLAGLVGLHYAHEPGMARGLNRFVAGLARGEPRLVPCATVLPGEPGAREVLDEALGPLGCRGVKIHCHVQCVAPDDPRLDDVFDAAAAHTVPLVIHAGDAPASPHYRCDVRALCPPAAFERALARHPRTTVVLPHLGAAWSDRAAELLDAHPNLHLDTTMALAGYFPVDETLRNTAPDAPRWLERALAIVRDHPDRVLYGSDFPNVPYEWDRELAALAAAGLPPDDLRAVAGGNAARLFRVPGVT